MKFKSVLYPELTVYLEGGKVVFSDGLADVPDGLARHLRDLAAADPALGVDPVEEKPASRPKAASHRAPSGGPFDKARKR